MPTPTEENRLPEIAYIYSTHSWRQRNLLLSLPWAGCALYRRLLESA